MQQCLATSTNTLEQHAALQQLRELVVHMYEGERSTGKI